MHVHEAERNRFIERKWRADDGDYHTRVRMEFESLGGDATLVRISESGWRKTPESLKSSYGNCMGWSQMLLCARSFIKSAPEGTVLTGGDGPGSVPGVAASTDAEP
ncbi:hypothetical protein ACN28S_26545 [Cystobacter fuscus]